ncbi:MAG: hypothetical protein ACTHNP_01675 [Solirubrobacterales bacterium]
MRRLLLAAIIAVLVLGVLSPVALAGKGNPSGMGPPNQSCQEIEAEGGTVPGHSSSSPGSPFNEPELNSEEGGTGGQHYNEGSQYDVACFHVSMR